MNSFLIIILATLPTFMWLHLFLISWKSKNQLGIIVFSFTVLKSALLNTYTGVGAIVLGFKHELATKTFSSDEDLLFVVAVEFVANAILYGGIYAFLRKKLRGSFSFNKRIGRAEQVLIAIYLIGGIVMYLNQASFGSLLGQSLLFNYIKQFFAVFPLVLMGVAFLKNDKGKFSFFLIVLSSTLIVIMLYITFVHGVRGRIVYVAQSFLLMFILLKQYKSIVIVCLLSLLLLPFIGFLGTAMRQVSYYVKTQDVGFSTFLDELNKEYQSYSTADDRSPLIRGIEELSSRLQGQRNSIAFIGMRETSSYPSLTHNLGALFYPIPRFLWPSKPELNTIGYGEFSTAMYLVMSQTYGKQFSYISGPYLVSMHHYWELGWLGVILYSSISMGIWVFLFTICMKSNRVLGIIIIAAFMQMQQGDPFLSLYVTLGNLLAGGWQLLLVPFVIYKIITLFTGESNQLQNIQ